MELKDIRPAMAAQITQIREENPIRQRLRQFGLVPGTVVRCLCGEAVVALEVLGTEIAVRRRDLAGIFGRVLP